MTIAIYTGNPASRNDSRFTALMKHLSGAGCILYDISEGGRLVSGTDILLAVGGDGTFLNASVIAGNSGVPVAGVNMGRLGFLSENRPEDVAVPLLAGDFTIENRTIVKASVSGTELPHPFALNEIGVHRIGGSMLGIDVSVDCKPLPTYWADGLLVATASGSTAYSLSVGGPIVTPDAKVLIISPIAPHNLNVRPLVIPESAVVSMRFHSREASVSLSADNRSFEIPSGSCVEVAMAQFSLKRLRLGKSDFFSALTTKLFWGEDIRNGN